MLWPAKASNNARVRRIDLDPASKLGTHRHTIEGWGLISLRLGGISTKGLHPSYTNHNSEGRAIKWSGTYPDWGPPSEWDWDLVTRTSSKLNARIRTLACTKIDGRFVLPAAKQAVESGAFVHSL
jgi:hypothetical protein